jgi:hypothetical protein
MTDKRFWKIADKYERVINHATESEVIITDKNSAMKEIVYYNRGNSYKSNADFALLIKGYPNKDECLTIANICVEYENLGMKEFRKKYKNIFTNN